MEDAEFQPIYCRWAEKKWPAFGPVAEVRFDIGEEPGYSEWTPGWSYLEVMLVSPGGRRVGYECEAAEVVNEVTRAALTPQP